MAGPFDEILAPKKKIPLEKAAAYILALKDPRWDNEKTAAEQMEELLSPESAPEGIQGEGAPAAQVFNSPEETADLQQATNEFEYLQAQLQQAMTENDALKQQSEQMGMQLQQAQTMMQELQQTVNELRGQQISAQEQTTDVTEQLMRSRANTQQYRQQMMELASQDPTEPVVQPETQMAGAEMQQAQVQEQGQGQEGVPVSGKAEKEVGEAERAAQKAREQMVQAQQATGAGQPPGQQPEQQAGIARVAALLKEAQPFGSERYEPPAGMRPRSFFRALPTPASLGWGAAGKPSAGRQNWLQKRVQGVVQSGITGIPPSQLAAQGRAALSQPKSSPGSVTQGVRVPTPARATAKPTAVASRKRTGQRSKQRSVVPPPAPSGGPRGTPGLPPPPSDVRAPAAVAQAPARAPKGTPPLTPPPRAPTRVAGPPPSSGARSIPGVVHAISPRGGGRQHSLQDVGHSMEDVTPKRAELIRVAALISEQEERSRR